MTAAGPLPDLAAAAAALAGGAVVLLPTDTIPGLHARADLPAALARLTELKGRPSGKPLVVIAGSLAQVAVVAAPVDVRAQGFLARCWPGPFSVVLAARPEVAAAVTAGTGTVAVRVPALAWLRKLALAAGAPLASTSANLAGELPAGDFEAALARFAGRVASFPGEDPETIPGVDGPSALVDLTAWPPRLLREGPQPLPDLPPDA
jgi:L-threonylcarbamoyladenylate synthase